MGSSNNPDFVGMSISVSEWEYVYIFNSYAELKTGCSICEMFRCAIYDYLYYIIREYQEKIQKYKKKLGELPLDSPNDDSIIVFDEEVYKVKSL